MDSFPVELLLHIIEFLKDEELVTAGLVCTSWNNIGKDINMKNWCLCCLLRFVFLLCTAKIMCLLSPLRLEKNGIQMDWLNIIII